MLVMSNYGVTKSQADSEIAVGGLQTEDQIPALGRHRCQTGEAFLRVGRFLGSSTC